MTARADLVEIVCDGPDKVTDCPDSAAMATYGTAGAVRKTLREDRWATGLPGGLDRCAKCRVPEPSRSDHPDCECRGGAIDPRGSCPLHGTHSGSNAMEE